METKTNPATTVTAKTRRRIPLSTPNRKLEVPDVPGYHLHWFLDINVPRALDGGYEFVDVKDVAINQSTVGSSSASTGSTDLGSHVKVIGGIGSEGRPEHLNLMKIREEWWKEDQKVLEDRNASVMGSIFRDEPIVSAAERGEDTSQRYLKTAVLNRPTRKSAK